MADKIGGLDTIINQINNEAQNTAHDIIENAKAEAEEIINIAKKEAEKIIEDTNLKAEKFYQTSCERGKNAIEHNINQEILAKKYELLSLSINNSLESLKNTNIKFYFEFIQKLLIKYAKNSEGILLFSYEDFKRMPDSLKKYIKKDFDKLEIKESDRVDFGFIIKYGNIEENCTLDALLESNMDSIKEKAYKRLFD